MNETETNFTTTLPNEIILHILEYSLSTEISKIYMINSQLLKKEIINSTNSQIIKNSFCTILNKIVNCKIPFNHIKLPEYVGSYTIIAGIIESENISVIETLSKTDINRIQLRILFDHCKSIIFVHYVYLKLQLKIPAHEKFLILIIEHRNIDLLKDFFIHTFYNNKMVLSKKILEIALWEAVTTNNYDIIKVFVNNVKFTRKNSLIILDKSLCVMGMCRHYCTSDKCKQHYTKIYNLLYETKKQLSGKNYFSNIIKFISKRYFFC